MSDSPRATPEAFALDAAINAAGVPPFQDDLGRWLFTWPVGQLRVAPFGRLAKCRVVLIDDAGQLASRELTLGTDAAALLARLLRILAREQDPPTDLCCEIITGWALDTNAGYESARREADALDPPDPESRPDARLRDPLHVDALRERFPHTQISRLTDGTVRASYPPDAEFTVSRSGSGSFTVALDGPDGDRHLERTPEHLLCLFAVQENLSLIDKASRFVDGLRVANLWAGLHDLRLDLIAGLDPRAGHERHMRLLDPRAAGPSESTPLGQLAAIATNGGLMWIARRGVIDPEPAAARAVRELEGEHVLQCEYAEVVYRYEGGLAIGRATVVDAGATLVSHAVALTRETSQWLAWAMTEIDFHACMAALGGLEASADAAAQLVQRVLTVVEEPWLDA